MRLSEIEITENHDIDEARGDIRRALAGAALLAGLWGVSDYYAQKAYDASPQLQKLTAYLEVAKQHNDQRMIDQLEKRIEAHKARLDSGSGEVLDDFGKPIEVVYDKQTKESTGIPFNECPQCGGEIFHESEGKKDACYHKVKSRYKVWPSAYASGALVQCRKVGAKNWGNKSKKNSESLNENSLKALRFATKAHKGQTRRSGEPYITHPKDVARFVKQFKQSNNLDALIQAAYLHDTIEDTNTTYEDLVKQFGGLVADMVKELTSDKEAIEALGKGEYIANKMAKMSSWALVVKLADRLANVQDIDSQPSEFQKRYANQTKQAIERLRNDRYLSSTHNEIISAIEDKIKEYY